MDNTINVLSKMKPATGVCLYLNICSEIGLEDDDPTESLFEKGMRSVARVILTAISIPFFSSLSILYNSGLAIIKGSIVGFSMVFRCIFKLEQNKEMMNDAIKHVASAATDLFALKFSLLLALGYAALPEQINSFYHRLAECISVINIFELQNPGDGEKAKELFL